jgi:hypothetical protein
MMVVKKCCALKAERHHKENVMIFSACATQVHCRIADADVDSWRYGDGWTIRRGINT